MSSHINSHPIEGLMDSAMENIKNMVDVNTIVGDPVNTPDGSVIIPISKVSFGFAAGGADYSLAGDKKNSQRISGGDQRDLSELSSAQIHNSPFGGGSGAGISINPVAFLVVGNNQVKLLPVDVNTSVNKVLDAIPDLMDKLKEFMSKRSSASGTEYKAEGVDTI